MYRMKKTGRKEGMQRSVQKEGRQEMKRMKKEKRNE